MNGKGSASDVDIYFVDDAGNPITLCDDDPDALVCQFPAARQDIRQRAGRVTGPNPIPHSKGFDFDSGFGFVDAATALRLTAGF